VDYRGPLGLEATITSRFASFRVGSLAFAARTATLTSRCISFPMTRLPTLFGIYPPGARANHGGVEEKKNRAEL
jgi:hypothetical protein